MNIRRFVAADMREVLAAIRAELGADAVMLSTRKVPTGVEVIAAIDYDESLVGGAARARRPLPAAALAIAPRADRGCGARPRRPRRPGHARPRAQRSPTADDDVAESGADDLDEFERAAAAIRSAALQRASLQAAASKSAAREVTAQQTAAKVAAARATAPGSTPTLAAEPANAGRRRRDQGLAPAARDAAREPRVERLESRRAGARAAAARDGEVRRRREPRREAREPRSRPTSARRRRCACSCAVSATRCRSCKTDITDRGGVFAFLGPTGVGKTTTIAKIAARFVLRHGVDALGLVSTDTYRIGARQQLSNYARILARAAASRGDVGRAAPHPRRIPEQEARADRHGRHEPARRAARESVRHAARRGSSRRARDGALGRRRSRLPRRGAARVPVRESRVARDHEARRGGRARRRAVARDSRRACRSRIYRTASACPRICTSRRRSASGSCTTP